MFSLRIVEVENWMILFVSFWPLISKEIPYRFKTIENFKETKQSSLQRHKL